MPNGSRVRGSRVAAAVVLAAGASSRMGRSKPLLVVSGRPVVAWHCAALGEIADDVVVVVGAEGARVAAALPEGAVAVANADWRTTGPIDSLRVGLRALWPGEVPAGARAVVTPVDVIPATPATLEALCAAGGAAVPVGLDGADGHPVVIDAPRIAGILSAPPPGGLRAVLGDAARVQVDDPVVALDFDDPEAFRAAVDRWTSRR
jgi:molybdenum cofactor cytidylyltransferase